MQDVAYYRDLVTKLSYIGVELSAQRDVDALLRLILDESMQLANADAGSIYIIEGEGPNQRLAFKYTANHTVDYPYQQFSMPIDKHSIAGTCAVTGQVFNFKSMTETVEKLGFEHNRSYDEAAGYHTVNMLVLPLLNYEETVIGVLQLINKKSHQESLIDQKAYQGIVPFTRDDEAIIGGLASQAAILIERSQLYEAIQDTLASTIKVMVTALDQRDPITAGHSDRVAQYALDLGHYLQELSDGVHPEYWLDKEALRELYIAGLLHDVGKIGVPEYLLMKSSKLPVAHIESLGSRYRWLALVLELGRATCQVGDCSALLEDVEGLVKNLEAINQTGFLQEDQAKIIENLYHTKVAVDGCLYPLLTDAEYEQLSIPRGNLTGEERERINDHVRMSHDLLKNVKWTKTLAQVPDIASQHHEKLNGKGYPYGLSDKAIGLRGRMMAIADIFDALTAKDRPYKPAMPVGKAIAILREEVSRGALDGPLVHYFIKMIEERDGQSYES